MRSLGEETSWRRRRPQEGPSEGTEETDWAEKEEDGFAAP